VSKWLYEIDCAFKYACLNGHLNVSKWLYEIKPDINIGAEIDYAFSYACKRGNLSVAQWLYQIKPDINICAENDEAFRYTCEYGNLVVAQWLCDLLPSKYHIEILNDRIINWYIKKIIIIDQTKNIHMNELTKCPICDESDINVQTNCAHLYCLDCINKWYNKSSKCPMCRQQITHGYHLTNIKNE
jgi:hypothetical protein